MSLKVCPEAKALAELYFPISRAFLRLMRASHMVPAELTPQQVKLIMELDMAGCLRLSDLSKVSCVTHGTMTVAVQKLLKKKLLIKKKDPVDERAVALVLTAQGKSAARLIERRTAEMFDAICRGIPVGERKTLVGVYHFLLKTYGKMVDRKGI